MRPALPSPVPVGFTRFTPIASMLLQQVRAKGHDGRPVGKAVAVVLARILSQCVYSSRPAWPIPGQSFCGSWRWPG